MLRVKNKKKIKKIIRKQKSKEWGLNWIQKLYETKFLGMKLKKTTSKSITSKTNSNQKNEN